MDHSDGVRLAVHRQLQPGEVRRWQRISDLANSNHCRRQAVGSSAMRRHHDAERKDLRRWPLSAGLLNVGKGAAPDGELNCSLSHAGAVSHGQARAAPCHSKGINSAHAAGMLNEVCRGVAGGVEGLLPFCCFHRPCMQVRWRVHACSISSQCADDRLRLTRTAESVLRSFLTSRLLVEKPAEPRVTPTFQPMRRDDASHM